MVLAPGSFLADYEGRRESHFLLHFNRQKFGRYTTIHHLCCDQRRHRAVLSRPCQRTRCEGDYCQHSFTRYIAIHTAKSCFSFTKTLRAPGPVDTSLFREGKPEQVVAAFANIHPLKRIGTVDDVAPVVAFLASPEAAWVNGQNILVNGVSTCVLCESGGANFVVNLGFHRLIMLRTNLQSPCSSLRSCSRCPIKNDTCPRPQPSSTPDLESFKACSPKRDIDFPMG